MVYPPGGISWASAPWGRKSILDKAEELDSHGESKHQPVVPWGYPVGTSKLYPRAPPGIEIIVHPACLAFRKVHLGLLHRFSGSTSRVPEGCPPRDTGGVPQVLGIPPWVPGDTPQRPVPGFGGGGGPGSRRIPSGTHGGPLSDPAGG